MTQQPEPIEKPQVPFMVVTWLGHEVHVFTDDAPTARKRARGQLIAAAIGQAKDVGSMEATMRAAGVHQWYPAITVRMGPDGLEVWLSQGGPRVTERQDAR